jgi:hypothetical protein
LHCPTRMFLFCRFVFAAGLHRPDDEAVPVVKFAIGGLNKKKRPLVPAAGLAGLAGLAGDEEEGEGEVEEDDGAGPAGAGSGVGAEGGGSGAPARTMYLPPKTVDVPKTVRFGFQGAVGELEGMRLMVCVLLLMMHVPPSLPHSYTRAWARCSVTSSPL